MALAPHLSGAQLGEALAAARAIEVELFRAQALTSLASKLCGENRKGCWRRR